MFSHRQMILSLLVLGIVSVGYSQTNSESALDAALGTIAAEDLMRNVRHLASEEFEGRLSGGEGYNGAARWVAEQFASCGLKPAGDAETYFQHFDVEYNEILSPARLNVVVADSVQHAYTIGEDFVARGFSGQGLMTAPVVFCGYGVRSLENDYDDYSGVEVRDKIVMVLKGAPSWEADWGDARWPRVKAQTAHEQGAIGMLLVSEPHKERSAALVGSVFHGPGEQLLNFPALHISQKAAADFLSRSGKGLTEVQTIIDRARRPHSFPLELEAHIEIHVRYRKRQGTMNVLGLWEGADPELKDTCVLVGAHLDHVGSQAEAITFPGANDNASGVSALLEIARAFSGARLSPQRSLLFIAFSAEEQGLYGSRFYAAHPVVPLDRTVAMINIDCIGAGEGMRVGGGQDYPHFYRRVLTVNEKSTQFDLPQSDAGGGADAAPFHERGIPNLYFATTKGYAHLHQISDTPETLNPELFEKAARLTFLTLWTVANEK
ncbi:MAG: M28 family peptidase [Gemmatimonadota bacterium]|nr:MAG: M28 family peptidase [Gemmatimonadota bacterium]